MTPAQFTRIEFLFHEALAQAREQRAAFLRALESDAVVVMAVERLLERDDPAAPDPLSARLAQVTRSTAPPPQQIESYRLLRELGAGGMGTVFLAERDVEGTAQKVALKLLHGFPTQAGKRRMARERALLAGLNHPNIAAHIDGGESADGQPYLVMDYVESAALPEYLAAAQPAVPARLRLFLSLCDAVQHAHQRLVLHRDIKPSNVIVRPDGFPVLLDFGVGILLEADEQPEHTATRAYTPGYGAPEQRLGQVATTATDVFGLGALLFDLLTDRRLSTLKLGDAPVPAPSSVVAEPARGRLLRGDLDRIVQKATAEDPERRYATATALADDVRRYLQGLPISAAPDRAWYRFRKFVKRHRVAVAAGSMVFVAAGLMVWGLDAARQRALGAEALARREAANASASRDFLASVLAQTSPEAVRGQPITISTLLANAITKLQDDRRQDVGARAVAWLTIAEVYSDIEDPRPGLAAVDTALGLFKQTVDSDLELQARALRVRSLLLTQLERTDEALDAAQQVIAIRQREGAGALAMARAYSDYGSTALHGSDFKTAERYHLMALQLSGSSTEQDPALRADILLGLTSSLYYQNDIDAAASYLAQAETAAQALPAGDGIVTYKLQRLAMLVRHLQHRYPESLDHAKEALRLAYHVYGNYSRLTADMELYLAVLLDDLGNSREAIPHYTRAQEIARGLKLDDATLARDDVRLAMAFANLGDDDKAVALVDSALTRMPDDQPAYVPWQIKARYTRGMLLAAAGNTAQAQADFERALQLARDYKGEIFVGTAFVQLRHAQALMSAGRFADAQTALDEAAPIERYSDLDPKSWQALQSIGASLALERGDLASAAQRAELAITLAERHSLPDSLPVAKAELLAARIAFRQGAHARARELLDNATPVLQRELSAEAEPLAEAARLAKILASAPPAPRAASTL